MRTSCYGFEVKNFTMGQISSQTQTVMNKLPEKVAKHASLVHESGFLTYEEFLGRVAELNDVIAKLASGQDKHLLFEVQPGSDSSAFWKVVVRIICTKVNKASGIVEASRILNLYQFVQLYKDITSQAAGVLAQGSTSEETAESLMSVSSCQASLWMGRVKPEHGNVTKFILKYFSPTVCERKADSSPAFNLEVVPADIEWDDVTTSSTRLHLHRRVKQLTDEDECCICMDGRADLILPCAHSFCQKCIDKWSDRHRSCPVCRRQVTGASDSWVVSDAPTEDDVATYILNMVDEAGQPHRP